MPTTDEVVAKATDGLDDNLQKGQDTKVPEPDTKDETAADGKKQEDDAGFTADEVEELEVAEPPKAKEVQEISTDGLDAEAKYIVDKLPVINTRIKDGAGFKDVQVKSWTQLPDDVEFASKRDELAFMNALTAQENRARDLQNEFRSNVQQEQNKEFEARETVAIREDITKLQKDGLLPKFKVKADDPAIEKDNAYQEAQKILQFMNERNEQYLKEYNQGRPFRHLGFEDAFHLYQRQSPSKDNQKQEDRDRREVADKVGGNRGLATNTLKKATVRSGTRIDQILDRIDAEW